VAQRQLPQAPVATMRLVEMPRLKAARLAAGTEPVELRWLLAALAPGLRRAAQLRLPLVQVAQRVPVER